MGWLVLIATWFALVQLQGRSPGLCLAMMALVWVADSAAYFAGHRFGSIQWRLRRLWERPE